MAGNLAAGFKNFGIIFFFRTIRKNRINCFLHQPWLSRLDTENFESPNHKIDFSFCFISDSLKIKPFIGVIRSTIEPVSFRFWWIYRLALRLGYSTDSIRRCLAFITQSGAYSKLESLTSVREEDREFRRKQSRW